MSNERIDLTQFKGMVEDLGEPCLNQDKMPLGNEWLIPHIAHLQCGYGMESDDLEQIRITVLAMSKTPNLIAELEKMYAREDELLDALRIIRDDLGDILPSNDSQELMLDKIYNFANDASE